MMQDRHPEHAQRSQAVQNTLRLARDGRERRADDRGRAGPGERDARSRGEVRQREEDGEEGGAQDMDLGVDLPVGDGEAILVSQRGRKGKGQEGSGLPVRLAMMRVPPRPASQVKRLQASAPIAARTSSVIQSLLRSLPFPVSNNPAPARPARYAITVGGTSATR